MGMSIGKEGVALIKSFEGFRSGAYKPVAAEQYWTIGYGHYGPDVRPGQTITKAAAEKLLIKDLNSRYVVSTNKMLGNAKVNQNQFDAMVSIVYNGGEGALLGSAILRHAKAGNHDAAGRAFLGYYVRGADGVPLAGLVRRRKAESALYLNKNWRSNTSLGGGGGDEGSQYKTFKEDYIKKNSATRPGTKIKKPIGIVIHTMPPGVSAKSYRNTLKSGNSGMKFGCHLLVDEKETLNIVPLEEQVYHAERDVNKSSISRPNTQTISIAVSTNKYSGISDKAQAKLIAVTAEIANTFSINSKNILYGYLVDGVKEPSAWVENPFLYSVFLGMVEKTKKDGSDIILNPDYQEGGGGGGGSANVVGKSHIAKLIREAETYEGKGSNGIAYRMGGGDIRHGGTGDCSSFTQALLMRHGVPNPGRNTVMQEASTVGKTLPLSQARPGDTIVMTANGSDGGGAGGHTGIVFKKGWMIDLHGPDPGGFVSKTNFGAPGYLNGYRAVTKRWYSDAVYEEYLEDQSGGKKPPKENPKPKPPEAKPTKTYTLRVNRPVNAVSKETGGQAVKRLSNTEVYRTKEVTRSSFKIDRGLYVKRNQPGIILSELENEHAPIGVVTVVNKAKVYKDKSFSAPLVVEKGADKVLNKGARVDVFEKQNGLLRINAPEKEEWIPASSGYVAFSSFIMDEFELEGDFLGGQDVEVEIGSKIADRTKAMPDSSLIPMANYTMAARETVYPIGSVVEFKIPTRPDFDGKAVVITNETDKNIELFVQDEVDKINFGSRIGMVRYVDFVEKNDINQYIQRELIKEEEIEDEDFS